MSEKLKVILFYKFVEIENPEKFAEEHREFCKKLGVVGKVLVAPEGINGSLSGPVSKMEEYMDFVRSYSFLEDVWFKEEDILEDAFTKMAVLVKPEIVALKENVDANNTVPHLSPEEFDSLVEDPEAIIIDTRNDYEYNVGHFKGAIDCKTKTFREFPEFLDKIKDKKDKKIGIYCTGGIRCEKAGALMKEEGFEKVYQLNGGIVNYCQTNPNKNWEGKCFVFDKRLVTDIENKNETVGTCYSCGKASDLFKNCKLESCDLFDVMCNSCQEKYHGCCSEECNMEYQRISREKAAMKRGIVAC